MEMAFKLIPAKALLRARMFQADGKACTVAVRARVHLSRQHGSYNATEPLGPDCRSLLLQAQARNLSLHSADKLDFFNKGSKQHYTSKYVLEENEITPKSGAFINIVGLDKGKITGTIVILYPQIMELTSGAQGHRHSANIQKSIFRFGKCWFQKGTSLSEACYRVVHVRDQFNSPQHCL